MAKPIAMRTGFRRILGATLTAGSLWLLAPSPASAQYYGAPILSERMVLGQLQAQGFRRMSPPVLNRDVFVLDAIDPANRPVRLIVSAHDGRIMDAHPQRHTRWTRIDPDNEWDTPSRESWRHRREERWQDSRQDRHARRDDGDWRRNGSRLPQVDPDDDADWPVAPQPQPQPRNQPERYTTAPLPAPPPQRDPDIPAPTLKNPTIVKRSPTAIPRDPGEKPAAISPAPGAAPLPGAGTRQNPRVIELVPTQPPKSAMPPPKAAATAPQPPKTAPPTAAPATTKLPPPAILDSPPAVPQVSTPNIPPATFE